MLRSKSPRLESLEHYLELRRSTEKPRSKKGSYVVSSVAMAAIAWLTFRESANPEWFAGCLAFSGYFGFKALQPPPPVHKNRIELEMLHLRADPTAEYLREQSARRRLHLALHPGVAMTLNECAGLWRRIMTALDDPRWMATDLLPHWRSLREEAYDAANATMNEALVYTEGTITRRPRRIRPERLVEELLDTYVFGSRESADYLPPGFAPVRQLAEKLKALALEVERANLENRPAGASFEANPTERRLDEVLSELRTMKEAESELRRETRIGD